ncbi:MAG: type VI secretion system protein TssA [Pseudomonadota bacterium]
MTLSLTSLGDELPSGENLEYEQVFTDLTLAAQPAEERQVGDDVIAGEEADPRAISTAAEAVLAQSHDLRAAVLWGYAKLRTDGYPGFAEATAYLRGCLEQFWETCHPQLDADDDDDPTMRVNAVLDLADPAQTLRALRRAPLTESRSFGRISVRDVMIAAGEMDLPEGDEAPPDASSIAAAFRDTGSETLDAILAAARAAEADIVAINAVFDDKIPGQGPTLEPVLTLLKRAISRLAEATGEDVAEGEAAVESPGASASSAAPAVSAVAGPGEIASPRDVERALEAIIRYYERSEPSSPVPVILERAKRLIGADFMTIVNDMAPAGADNVRLVGGIEAPESGGDWSA